MTLRARRYISWSIWACVTWLALREVSTHGARASTDAAPSAVHESYSFDDNDRALAPVGGGNDDEQTKRAQQLRSAVPRFVGPNRFAPLDEGYRLNLVAYIAFGGAMAAVTLIAMVLWLLINFCKCFTETFRCVRLLVSVCRFDCGQLAPGSESEERHDPAPGEDKAGEKDEEFDPDAGAAISHADESNKDKPVLGELPATLTVEHVPQYTRRHIRCVWGWLAFFCLASFILCSVGLTENERLTETLTGTSDEAVVQFVPRFVSAVGDKLASVEGPIEVLFNSTVPVLDELELLFVRTDLFDTAIPAVVDAIRPTIEALELTETPTCAFCSGAALHCPECGSAAESLRSYQARISHDLSEPVNDLSSLVGDVQRYLLDEREVIIEKTNDVKYSVEKLTASFDESEHLVDEVLREIKYRDAQRQAATAGLCSLPVTASFVIILAVLLTVPLLFKVNIFFTFLVMIAMWLLFGVHLSLAMLMSDVCVAVNEAETNTLRLLNDSVVADSLYACLTNDSLKSVFNVTDQYQFALRVDFPPEVDFQNVFDRHVVNASDAVHRVTLSSFSAAFTEDAVQSALTHLSMLSGEAFPLSLQNVSLNASMHPWKDYVTYPNNGSDHELRAWNWTRNNITFVADAQQADRWLSNIQWEFSSNMVATYGVQTQLAAVQYNVSAMAELLSPLFLMADTFLAAQTCGFLGDLYRSAKSFLCVNAMNHVSVLAFSFWFIAWCGVFICLLSAMATKLVAPHSVRKPVGLFSSMSNVHMDAPQIDDDTHSRLVQMYVRPQAAPRGEEVAAAQNDEIGEQQEEDNLHAALHVTHRSAPASGRGASADDMSRCHSGVRDSIDTESGMSGSGGSGGLHILYASRSVTPSNSSPAVPFRVDSSGAAGLDNDEQSIDSRSESVES